VTPSTLNRLAPTEVELEIAITQDELAAAQERAFKKLAKNVRLPGFRPGKVPRKVFEQTYGSDAIESQALEDVVPELFAKAVREHALEPVDRPRMELLPAEADSPARFKATVTVRPEIVLGDYKGLEVTTIDPGITEQDVERSLLALARERATLVPVERAARIGDVVTVDYEGRIEGTPFDGGAAKGQVTELDEQRFIPGFASGIAGMTAGESRNVEAIFPADYQKEDLAGKTAVFAVTLHDVKELELPPLDDDFAKTVSDNQSAEDLRADVRRRLEAIAQSRSRRELGNRIVEKLIAAHDFPLPDAMVERELDHMMNDAAANATRMGLSFEDYLARVNKTDEGLRAESRDDARMRVKGTLLMEAVAKAEGIVATPADVQVELEALSGQYGQPVNRIRKALGGNLLSLMDGIIRNKTLEFLIDNAKTVPLDKEATEPASS
jgi:trigger factor